VSPQQAGPPAQPSLPMGVCSPPAWPSADTYLTAHALPCCTLTALLHTQPHCMHSPIGDVQTLCTPSSTAHPAPLHTHSPIAHIQTPCTPSPTAHTQPHCMHCPIGDVQTPCTPSCTAHPAPLHTHSPIGHTQPHWTHIDPLHTQPHCTHPAPLHAQPHWRCTDPLHTQLHGTPSPTAHPLLRCTLTALLHTRASLRPTAHPEPLLPCLCTAPLPAHRPAVRTTARMHPQTCTHARVRTQTQNTPGNTHQHKDMCRQSPCHPATVPSTLCPASLPVSPTSRLHHPRSHGPQNPRSSRTG